MTFIHERGTRWPTDVFRRFLKITGPMKLLAGAICFIALVMAVQAQVNVTLAWNPSSDPLVAGFNIYYGGASGVYTNKINAGTNASLTISDLVAGATYYFVATTYSAAGAESAMSSEVSYIVPGSTPGVRLLVTPTRQFVLTVTGLISHANNILASQDLTTWTVIGTVTTDANGLTTFTDTNAPGFSRRFYRIN